MIKHLHTPKAAYFFRKTNKITRASVEQMFADVRREKEKPSNNIFKHIKESYNGAAWSSISFSFLQEPSFLKNVPSDLRERIYGFLLMVEYKDHVLVFKSKLDITADFKGKYLQRISTEKVECSIATESSTFEKIRLRSMTTSKYSLQAKTLEAKNLGRIVGPSGSNRYFAHSYRVRHGDDCYSATPSTGRITLRSSGCNHLQLVEWSIKEIDKILSGGTATSSFIRNFARPVELSSIGSATKVTYVSINSSDLYESLFESAEPMRLIKHENGVYTEIDYEAAKPIFKVLETNFAAEYDGALINIVGPNSSNKVGRIVIGKTRISLRSFKISEIEDIFIEHRNHGGALGTKSIELSRYLDKENMFTVLFSDYTMAYIDGSLYRDEFLVDGGGGFLNYIITCSELKNATSEKGNFSATHQEFDPDSVFGIAVKHICHNDEILICDDLLEEWADFIGVSYQTQPRVVSFYHAKHGALSLGATHFHISVSQAIKNLGLMLLEEKLVEEKLKTWGRNYNNDGKKTKIGRIIRGDSASILAASKEVREYPDSIRRVYIVTSSLSKGKVKDVLDDIKKGGQPDPYFVQMYWLLSSYFSACAEVGVYPYVVCQE
ncbi:hypothetical protein [Azospirillum brasilense]|uniref:hypothetical protein n=1 Tax=Azospirillum brasilense TaxID=192 RepID=UPI0013B39734|nr:hypothetical protein [Azospirillum brasilense]